MPLLVLFPIFGYMLALFYFVRRHSELILFGTVSGIIFLLYLAALAGFLKAGAFSIFYVGIALLVPFSYLVFRDRALSRDFLTPGISLFIVLCVVHWVLFKDATYFFWDEFSHWGLVTKQMLFAHRLYDTQGAVLLPHYPPGAGLWQYFVCVNTMFSEGATYFAQFILLVSPLMVLFTKVKYKQLYWIVAILFFMIFLVTNLGHGITNLYVDHVLSAYFGAILFAWLAGRYTRAELLLFFPPLFCLPLIKEVGLFLALAGSLFILLHGLLLVRTDGEARSTFLKNRTAFLVTILIVCSAPLISSAGWKIRLNHLEVQTFKPEENSFSKLVHILLSKPAEEKKSIIKERFIELFVHQQMSRTKASMDYNEFYYSVKDKLKEGLRLSPLGWFLFTALLFLLSFWINKEKQSRTTVLFTFSFLSVMFLIYSIMLLYLYLFILQQERIPSYDRYYNILIMPMLLLAGGFLLPALHAGKERGKNVTFYAFLALTAYLCAFETPYLAPLTKPNPKHEIRTKLAATINSVKSRVDLRKKMYVVFLVKENGFQRIMLHYDLAPIRSEISPFDFNTQSETQISDTLKSYDYVWCLACSPSFFNEHAGLFSDQPMQPYRMFRTIEENGKVLLEPIM